MEFYWSPNGSSDSSVSASFTFQLNTWYHVAMSKSGTSVRLFVNGIQQGSTGTFTSIYNGSSPFRVGTFMDFTGISHCFAGYISNLRIVKGTAVYTSNFTPSTTPLTAISGTSLLTCQSNRFIDNSSNAFAITVNGTPTVQRFSPFSPTAVYSTSTIGGSGYFDGSGDYLSAANNAALNLGTGDFTLEAWIYVTSFSGNNTIFDKRTTTGSAAPWVWYTDTAGKLNFYTGTNYITTSSFSLNTWTHVVTSRVSGTLYQFINGVSAMTSTSVTANIDTSGTLLIGTSNDGAPVYAKGYISDLRIVKGSGVTSVTVPTSPLTAISGTSLLLSATNAGIIDNTMLNNLETVGNAQISSAQTKFGSGSMYFDGTGDALRAQSNAQNLQFGTGDFTVECWLYQTATNAYPGILEIGNHLLSTGILFIANNGSITAYSAAFLGSATPPALNAWSHIAWVRSSGVFKIYVNGVGNAGVAFTGNLSSSSNVTIGADSALSTNYTYSGYIDDLRITKGYARYTTTFTPATSAFPTY